MFIDNLLQMLLGSPLEFGKGIFNARIGVVKMWFGALSFESSFWNIRAVFDGKDSNSVSIVEAKSPKIMARDKMLASFFRTH